MSIFLKIAIYFLIKETKILTCEKGLGTQFTAEVGFHHGFDLLVI